MRLTKTVGMAILLMQSAFLFGQTNNTLTLDQAVQIALERNINVAQAANNVQSAQSGVLAAYGGYLPTLSANAQWQRSQNDRVQEPIIYNGIVISQGTSGRTMTNYFNTGVNLNYMVFDGFGREGQVTRATSTAVSTEQQTARTRQSVVFQTQSDYLNVLRNEQLVKVNEENLKRDRQQLDRITESNRVGALSIADVYRQQSQVAADELALIQAQNTYDKSVADLLALIGVDVNENYKVADPTISLQITKEELDTTTAKYQNFSDLSRRALAARPDYLSAAEQLNASQGGVTAARSNYFPSVSAFAGYGLSSQELRTIADNKSLNWGVRFNWNIFDAFQTNYQLQSAIATRRNAEISLVQTERSVNVDVKKALLDLEAARKQYDVTQKGLVSATEDRKIAEERYNLGAGTLLDLMVANANLVNAEANQVNAVYNYITAKRNVEYSVGEISY